MRETIALLKLGNRDVARAVRAQSKRVIEPALREEMAATGPSAYTWRGLVDTSRVRISDQNVTVQTGAVKGRFSGGLDMRVSAASMEFGSNGGKTKTYQRRSRKGGAHSVTRRTMTQFGGRARQGRVFYPAVRDLAPRVVSLWVQTVMRIYGDAIDGKR